MKILVKRVYEPVAKPDGFRVLIDRLWPRGLSKPDARLDLWLPDLGPSTALRKWFNHDPARWTEFCRRYHAELKKKTGLLATITEQAKASTVTLLYSAKDERHNQAVALRSFLVKRKVRLGSVKARSGGIQMKDAAFQELLTSIKQAGKIRRGRLKPSRVTTFRPTDVKGIREKLNASQTEFALMIGVSVATLRNWEQGRRRPDGPALALLRVAARNPRAVAEALHRESHRGAA